jgi:hypothetical protein
MKMKITGISASGSMNMLKWALSNGANPKSDTQVMSIINDEMFYLIDIEDVNFYELYQLTHVYRHKLRVSYIARKETFSQDDLKEYLGFASQECAAAIDSWVGISKQMLADDDIISNSTSALFCPMISHIFNIQIPLVFADAITAMSPGESEKIFAGSVDDHIAVFNDIIANEEITTDSAFKQNMMLGLDQYIRGVVYNKRYTQLLQRTKFFPFKSKSDKLFRVGFIGAFKYDTLTRGQIRLNMFNATPEDATSTFAKLARSKSPLQVDIAVQLPMYYMQIIESSFLPEDIKTSYISTRENVIENGLVFKELLGDQGDHQQEEGIETPGDVYGVRIAEAEMNVLRAYKSAMNSNDAFIDRSFALLPPLYRVNGVLTFQANKLASFQNHSDSRLVDLFNDIAVVVNPIVQDINKL